MTETPSAPRLVVGVGASAGGLEAFKALLLALPDDRDMAFVLVQHLDPTHESLLAELLAPSTRMRVREADQGTTLEANCVYIIRPDTALGVRDGKIELSEPTLQRGVRLPVDHLFRSLAREYGARSVAIILSGAGSDGSAGIRSVKSAGGLTIAQNPQRAQQQGMPQSAIDTGLIDLVLDIPEIPAALDRFQGLSPHARIEADHGCAEGDGDTERHLCEEEIVRLASLLDAHAGFDLRVYKHATVERRILRRMGLSGFDQVEPYLEHLRGNPAEQQALMRDMLISVTEFFRDPAAFEALRQMVIDPLVAQAASGDTLRAWVPGCATGEEPYSIAMEFLDAINEHGKRLRLQIFATDIDDDALTIARTGIYPLSIAEQVKERYLNSYFKAPDSSRFRVRPLLRDTVSFAVHDLTKDPPFSRMHLVSCRNVLIYLNPETQKRVLKVLHFALAPEGALLLSPSESTGSQQGLFSALSKSKRIYRKLGASQVAIARSRNRSTRNTLAAGAGSSSAEASPPAHGSDLARRAVLEAFAPPTLVVAEDGAVIFVHGELDAFVRIPQGDNPRFELGEILRPELATRVRGALYKCRRIKESVTAFSSPDESGDQVRIRAQPAPTLGEEVVMLAFETVTASPGAPPARAEVSDQHAAIDQLEKELSATREDLRNTVEELETSNEELRSSNEESMSMNEELQSSNEELEATTEELRALNEKLTTLNAQLREKIEQVEQASDDLHNFFASTKIATLFLDHALAIKRFTPAARELLGIDHSDIGRNIADIAARDLLQNDLVEECNSVLQHLSTRSVELCNSEGTWVTRQVLPYRTEGNRIEGVVVTFVDITKLKAATEQLAIRERQQNVIAQLGLQALRETDLQGCMDRVVRDVQRTLDTHFCKILELQPGHKTLLLRAGVGWNRDIVANDSVVAIGPDSQAGYTLNSQDPVIVDDLSKEKRFSGPKLLTDHGVTSGISCVIREGDHVYGVIGAHTRDHRIFTQEDANFLQAVGTVVGLAIGRHQTRLRIGVEVAAATVLAQATSVDAAVPAIAKSMALALSASIAEVWWYDSDARTLSRDLLHVKFADARAKIEGTLRARTFDRGEGLVGTVYANETSCWVTDLAESEIFVRRDQARKLGLVSALGLPIRAGKEVLGVMTFFSEHRLIGDDNLLRSLDAIGSTIGDFMRRIDADLRTRQSESRKAAMVRASLDGIVTIDGAGRIVEFNEAAQTMFGYSEMEAINQDMGTLIVPERLREAHWQGLKRVMAGGEKKVMGRRIEMPALRRDGSEFFVELAITESSEENPRLYTGFIRDITERRRMEVAIREADRQKDEFLAMLGHELRNPVAAIRSAAELLKIVGGEDTRITRTSAVLERQSAHIAKLLDGLLDVARIIRGKIQLDRQVVDIAGTCRLAVAEISERLHPREITLNCTVDPGPIWVEADPVRLSQVFDNLLTNALKYTGDGGEINVSMEQEDELAVLRVRDSGVGIAPDMLPHVFDIFWQSKQNLDRSQGGLGIGLALVKTLVERHGGKVEAHSAGIGEGAEFIVRLPVTKKVPQQRSDEHAGVRGSLQILVIEDREDSAAMLKELLELSGHRVTVATSGREGVDLAIEMKPDIVLCDIGLPGGMSGFDVAAELRKDPKTANIRLVALTGYGRPEDKQRSADAGFDAHLTKPIDLTSLAPVLATAS